MHIPPHLRNLRAGGQGPRVTAQIFGALGEPGFSDASYLRRRSYVQLFDRFPVSRIRLKRRGWYWFRTSARSRGRRIDGERTFGRVALLPRPTSGMVTTRWSDRQIAGPGESIVPVLHSHNSARARSPAPMSSGQSTVPSARVPRICREASHPARGSSLAPHSMCWFDIGVVPRWWPG